MNRARSLGWLAVVALTATALLVAATRDAAPATNDERAHALAEELKCPTCRSQSVADSDAPASRAIRLEITRRIEVGDTDSEIQSYLTDRYGQEILLKPPGRGIMVLVWLVPPVAIGAAFAGITLAFRRWRRPSSAVVSDDDRARVAAALGDR